MIVKEIKEVIPYVILEAHPDYKRPYVKPVYGMVQKSKLIDTLLENLVDFVYDKIDIDNLTDVKDVDNFWREFYNDTYMSNPPWEATAIINEEWTDISFSSFELFSRLLEEKNKNSIYM